MKPAPFWIVCWQKSRIRLQQNRNKGDSVVLMPHGKQGASVLQTNRQKYKEKHIPCSVNTCLSRLSPTYMMYLASRLLHWEDHAPQVHNLPTQIVISVSAFLNVFKCIHAWVGGVRNLSTPMCDCGEHHAPFTVSSRFSTLSMKLTISAKKDSHKRRHR